MSIDKYDILQSPHLTEKATLAAETAGRQVIVFKVKKSARKHQIQEAVEKLFGVKVEKVRTATFRGKVKRQGRFSGRRPDWKKAYVTLKAGEKKVEFFEGA